MTECIFCKIANKEMPANIIYEDDSLIAFHDIFPKANVHFLIIPKRHIGSMLDLQETDQSLIGHIMLTANLLAKKLGLVDGYKINIHNGAKGGQEVFHLHVHVMSGQAK